MPTYIYQNPKTEEIIEVIQTMNEEHKFFKNGIEWKRVFINPKVSIDTQINPHSEKDFHEKLKSKNYSLGDLWDKSKELSEQREKVLGKDPVKEKTINDYEKKTKGSKHPSKIFNDIEI